MALCCAISNEVPEQPVISPVSGHIYERRLIEKYIKENGSDPMNGEKLGIEMLVDVKASALVKPRPPRLQVYQQYSNHYKMNGML